MNNIKDFGAKNTDEIAVMGSRKSKGAINANPAYLTDEALEALIAETEAGSMLHPPKGFHDDILSRIHRKRRYRKNLQLFSYSMKVIVATAAALGIVLIVPVNVNTEESRMSGYTSEWLEGQAPESTPKSREQERIEKEKKKLEEQIQKEKERNEKEREQILKERERVTKEEENRKKSAKEGGEVNDGDFIDRINSQMNEYVSDINSKLGGYVKAITGKQ